MKELDSMLADCPHRAGGKTDSKVSSSVQIHNWSLETHRDSRIQAKFILACFAQIMRFLMSSSFFKISPGVRSNSSAILRCTSAEREGYCSHRSPSTTSLTGK